MNTHGPGTGVLIEGAASTHHSGKQLNDPDDNSEKHNGNRGPNWRATDNSHQTAASGIP